MRSRDKPNLPATTSHNIIFKITLPKVETKIKRSFITAIIPHLPLVCVLFVAFLFRFWLIKTLPGGLFPDEAANGLDVNSILDGDVQPFYERGNGREALFFYFLAAVVALFGRGPWQHHIISGGFGVVAVLVTYFLAKRMFGKRVALL